MHVEFLTNVGSRDAQRFNLDFLKCTKGAVVEVEDEVGALLCAVDKPTGITFARAAEKPVVRAVAREADKSVKSDK